MCIVPLLSNFDEVLILTNLLLRSAVNLYAKLFKSFAEQNTA